MRWVNNKNCCSEYITGIDKDIENLAKSCLPCLENKSQPAAAPLHPWIWPTTPWKRIHIDFAGPFLDKMFLIVVDAHSKWPEVIQMSSTTSFKTIEALRSLFAKYGLPEQLVSDLLKPNVESVVTTEQSDQKTYHDQHVKQRYFSKGQLAQRLYC